MLLAIITKKMENTFLINKRVFITKYKQCFCSTPELIENFEEANNDASQVWECHHRLETHNSDGERRLVDITKKELIALGMYNHRPPEEFIFLTGKGHARLHYAGKPSSRKGKRLSDTTREKLRHIDKSYTKTEEYRKNMSKAVSAKLHQASEDYKEYKKNGGLLEWNEFQKMRKQ